MSGNFKFNWDMPALDDVIELATDALASDYTVKFEKLRVAHTGDSVAVIKPKVARILREHGGSATDAEITEYAQTISDGTRVIFESDIQ